MMDWNETNVARLTARVAEGKTGAEIAAELGVTRNVVMGKIHRLHLTGPRSTGPNPHTGGTDRAQRRRLARIKRAHQLMREHDPATSIPKTTGVSPTIGTRQQGPMMTELPVFADAPTPLLISYIDRKHHQCTWPYDVPDNYSVQQSCCGHHAPDGRWCDFHAAKTYRPVRGRAY